MEDGTWNRTTSNYIYIHKITREINSANKQ